MLKADGEGDLFVNAFRDIIQKDLQDNEKMILDNHHLVDLSENSSYGIIEFGGLKTTILGGQRLLPKLLDHNQSTSKPKTSRVL